MNIQPNNKKRLNNDDEDIDDEGPRGGQNMMMGGVMGDYHSGKDSEVREQDRYLPIANIARIMKKVLPNNSKVGKDAKESIQECVSEFISFITSEASDKCQQEKRKTINGDDLLWAMSTLGFDKYIDPLKIYLAKYRESVKGEKPDKKMAKKVDTIAQPKLIPGMHGGMINSSSMAMPSLMINLSGTMLSHVNHNNQIQSGHMNSNNNQNLMNKFPLGNGMINNSILEAKLSAKKGFDEPMNKLSHNSLSAPGIGLLPPPPKKGLENVTIGSMPMIAQSASNIKQSISVQPILHKNETLSQNIGGSHKLS